jgi:hypothetical protein
MVGTAYRAFARRQADFVEVGSKVVKPATVSSGRGDEDLQRHRRAARRHRDAILVEDGTAGRIWRTALVIIE